MKTTIIIKDARYGFERMVQTDLEGEKVFDFLKDQCTKYAKLFDVSVILEKDSALSKESAEAKQSLARDAGMVTGLLGNQKTMPFLEIAAMAGLGHDRLREVVLHLINLQRITVRNADNYIDMTVTLVK